MRNKVFSRFVSTVLILAIWSIVGCSYDNTLYNAKKYYYSAQKKPLNQNDKPSPQAIDEYTKTIRKCGYILTERKNSSEVDDALYFLAMSLYHKGNSFFQAKDQFLNLIRNFPDSPYTPQAFLYLAKTYRQINEPKESENLLTNYIIQPERNQWHPAAIALLADFSIQDKDFIKARYWLEKLMSQYPKSKEGREASFLLGKNYLEQKDYINSILFFNKTLETRGISTSVKNDSRYLLAVNYMLLNNYAKSLSLLKKLLKEENRQEKIPLINLLLARNLINSNNEIEATDIFQSIIKSNSRTVLSAEAYYWMAEYYYYQQRDIQKAIDMYNKSKIESNTFSLFNDANRKQASLLKINQNANIQFENDPQFYIDTKLSIAEDLFTIFNKPDSAFSIIEGISRIPLSLQSKLDSLSIVKNNINIKLDSLDFISGLQQEPSSIKLDNNDSLRTDDVIKDTSDNSVSSKSQTRNVKNDVTYNNLSNELQFIEQDVLKTNALLNLVTDTYIPYSLFYKASIIYKSDKTSAIITDTYNLMNEIYPHNKYTKALKQIIEGKPVRLINYEAEKDEIEYDKALSDITDSPDSSLVILNRFAKSVDHILCTQANFRLGWYYTFENPDTTLAKTYYDNVLKKDRISDYAKLILRFYNGSRFINRSDQQDSLLQDIKSDTLDLNTERQIEFKTPDKYLFDNTDNNNQDSHNSPDIKFDIIEKKESE